MWNTFLFLLHVLPNIIGLVLNGVLFVLARYHSPHAIRKYSLLIVNFAVCDFFACLTSLIVFIFLGHPPYGRYCTTLRLVYCSFSYSVMLHLYAHTLYSMLMSFSFRYYVLNYRPPSRNQIKLIIFLVYLPSFVQMVLFSVADDPPELVEPLLKARFPHYNLTGRTITGNLDILEWKALSTILHMTLPITPVYICILFLRRGITQRLDDAVMSTRTRNLHRQLLTALTWQAVLPLFYLCAVLSYACGQLGVYHHPLLEHTTFISVGFIPALSPISSLYFVKQYRDCIRGFMCGGYSLSKSSKEISKDGSINHESHSSKGADIPPR
ncbi:unnamed protein product [Heligmosomoides polygyrus]|uniref:G_PROTEIN_RECEP_F1_2 domain-containing protein n=1 Tax=Heligmosomoides polygyrus TaxID=6339 RepID=A0A183FIP9_HELPZ|nr:unnamed protein product [Heligmosomoides polygyrus]